MSINYTNLSCATGSIIAAINSMKSWIADLDTYQTEYTGVLSAQGVLHLMDDVPDVYVNMQDRVTSFITTDLRGYFDKVLLDPDLVTSQLPIGDVGSVAEVLSQLRKDMLDTSNTVLANTVTVGSASYDLATSGSVVVLTTKLLDGISAPADYAAPDVTYAGVTSELSQDSQTITMTCSSDSESGGVSRGAERFTVAGNPANGSYHRNSEGMGETEGYVMNVQGLAIVENGSFDDWTGGNPDSWTINDGAAPTDFQEDANGIRGTSSFKIMTGATNIDISQIIPESDMPRRKAFCLVAMVYKAGTTGTCAITLKEGSTTIADLAIDISTASAGWNVYSDFFVVPDEIDQDWVLRIVANAAGFNGSPLLDDVLIVPVTYVNGIGYVLLTVHEKIIIGDEISFTVSNNNTGVFQTAFRRLYGVQLPSTGGTPTLPEVYATGLVVSMTGSPATATTSAFPPTVTIT